MERPPRSKRKGEAGRSGASRFDRDSARDPRPAEPSLAARALRMLARREHTRFELARKLAPYAQNPLEIEALLEHFSARGWLSETRVVDEIVHARCGRYGPARIRQVLAQRGVPEELIERAVVQLKAGELDTAGAVWARKFRSPPTSPTERARQVRFLQSRGFSFDIAMRIVRAVSRADAALDGD